MHPVKLSTGFPSAAKAAKELGVSKKVARDLYLLAERSKKSGRFVLPGVGRLVRVERKGSAGPGPAKKTAQFRVVKVAKNGPPLPKKKK